MEIVHARYHSLAELVEDEVSKYGLESAARNLSARTNENLDYTYVAGILLAKHLQNESLSEYDLLTQYPSLFGSHVRQFILDNYEVLNSRIRNDMDFTYQYRAIKTISSNYLFKIEGKPRESLQWSMMRMAVQVSMDKDGNANLQEVLDNYDMFSSKEATHATPTWTNAGFHRAQLESCFLVPVGDSMDMIQAARTMVAMGSKANGGFGLDCGRIRHSRVSNRGQTKGVPGMLKFEFNPLLSYADQLGSRPGACTAFLPIWHIDIYTFSKMGDRKSAESIRADNLNYSIWVQDLFMKRRLEDGTWSLFCPRETQKLWARLHGLDDSDSKVVDKCPSLHDMWGVNFEKFYLLCEKHISLINEDPNLPPESRTVWKANELWSYICEQRCRRGQPFIMYGDSCNRKSNQQHLGTITQSNLCVRGDTLILTDKGYVPIQEVVGQSVNVWNGEEWSPVVPLQTGENQELLTIEFSNGSTLHCTPYHKFYITGRDSCVHAYQLEANMQIVPFKYPNSDILQNITVTAIKKEDEKADTFCFTDHRRNRGIFNGILGGNCQEILQYTKPGEQAATCDLATVNLAALVKDGKFDFERLGNITRQLVRNLNRVLDVTCGILDNSGQKVLDEILRTYPKDSTEYKMAEQMYPHVKKDPTYTARMQNRAIGIGKMGLASTFMLLGMEYTSKEAVDLATRITACIYWHSVDESHQLAMKDGSYPSFEGSPMSKGILQPDMWLQETEYFNQYLDTLDKDKIQKMGLQDYIKRFSYKLVDPSSFGVSESWDILRERCKMGMRNSLLTCQMPNVTTSAQAGVTPSVEPIFSVLYSFNSVNGKDDSFPDAFRDVMMQHDLYDPVKLAEYLFSNKGDAKGISLIFEGKKKEQCKKLEGLFTRAYDINKKKYFLMIQKMGYYVCQSQSLNWYFELPSDKYMSELDILLWVNGAKNAQYYVYRKASADSISVTKTEAAPKICSLKDRQNGECLSCQ